MGVMAGVAHLGLRLAASEEQLPPDNDNFASRVVLAGEELTFVGQNRFATRETGEPAVPGAGGNASVWWSWTAPIGGYLTLQVTESDFGDILTAFAGGSLAHLTRLGGGTNSVDHVGLGTSFKSPWTAWVLIRERRLRSLSSVEVRPTTISPIVSSLRGGM